MKKIEETIKIDSKYHITTGSSYLHEFSLFNQNSFIKLHERNDNCYKFNLINTSKDICEGISNFGFASDKEINSPPIGSFGSFEFSDFIKYEIKENFIKKVLSYILDKKKYKNISITLPPDIYNLQNNCQVTSILFRNNFHIKRLEINQFINLGSYSYETSITRGNKKRIKKCLRNNFSFKKLNAEDYKSAYEVIFTNRKRRNFPITMTWEGLSEMIKTFPEKMFFFGIYNQSEMIASAICMKVSKKILYVFYWGEIGSYETYSPIAYLSYRIVEFAKENGFNILDVGTSSENSIPNHGLVTFKENIGCEACNKFYLERNLK